MEYLKNNDHAEGNAGGEPPELNTNAGKANGAWGDWEPELKRPDPVEREESEHQVGWLHREIAGECDHDYATLARLCGEYLVRRRLLGKGMIDAWIPEHLDGRGLTIAQEVEIDSESYTVGYLEKASTDGQSL